MHRGTRTAFAAVKAGLMLFLLSGCGMSDSQTAEAVTSQETELRGFTEQADAWGADIIAQIPVAEAESISDQYGGSNQVSDSYEEWPKYSWLMLCIQTGLRVSELISLNCADITTNAGSHVRCRGKGRKDRAIPLTAATAAVIGQWLIERAGKPTEPLFPTRTGRRLSRDAIEHRLTRHHNVAAAACTALHTKRLTPHTLRHTTAMTLLHAGVDTTVIALWLGHADTRSTDAYIHADMTIKERALARTTPVESPPGDSDPKTSCWRSSKGCNYADNYSGAEPETRALSTIRENNPAQVRIITESA